MVLPVGIRRAGRHCHVVLLAAVVWAVAPCALAQQAQSNLSIRTTTLPAAELRQPYQYRLRAEGGVAPLKWAISSGSLPAGMDLDEDVLFGRPTEAGVFSFVVTATDSGTPAHQKSQTLTLRVVAPLLAQWSQPPQVSGKRIEGVIRVANQTERDFDLTVIVLAVNEIGRATAIGYQRLTLKPNTSDFEIPFGEQLPPGAYGVNVDVVAEVPSTYTIHRARLVSDQKLQVTQGP